MRLSLCEKSTYERYSPLSAFFFFPVFALCGVEGIEVLPQVARTTHAAATSLEKKGKCRCCNGSNSHSNMWLQKLFHLFFPPLPPPCVDAGVLRKGRGLKQRVQTFPLPISIQSIIPTHPLIQALAPHKNHSGIPFDSWRSLCMSCTLIAADRWEKALKHPPPITYNLFLSARLWKALNVLNPPWGVGRLCVL